MLPSEHSVEAAIETLDAGAFQRLAESYAARMWPGRFELLAVHGRNSGGRTTAGWPDAFVDGGSNGVDVVEASRDLNWTRHLDDDVAQMDALPPPGLAGFVFVSWARTPRPAQHARYAAEIARRVAARRPHAAVSLVFRQQLVRDLTRPRFATVWREQLGIATSTLPWQDVRDAPVYGGATAAAFMLSREDFEDRNVVEPRQLRRVVERLEGDGWCFVLGRGAKGKTVLALQVAYRTLARGGVAYHLDLAGSELDVHRSDARAAQEVLTARADDDVLFVLDNVHRAPLTAAALKQHWDNLPHRGALLLLGRDVEHRDALAGIVSPLSALEQRAVRLRLDRRVLRGIAQRLLAREGLEAPPLAEGQVRRWAAVFGGDLVAFSAAVARRVGQSDPWDVTAADARDYMWDRYLADLDESERLNLLRVADLSAVELVATDGVVDRRALSRALRDGVIERTPDGFRTVHPGLGELLLAAADARVGDFSPDSLLAKRERTVSDALSLAGRLLVVGNEAAARDVLQPVVVTSSAAIEGLLLRGASGIPQQRRVLDRGTDGGLDALLAEDPEAIGELLRGSSFDELITLLREAGRHLPLTARLMHGLVAERVEPARVAHGVAALPSRKLPLRIRQVRHHLPALYDAVLEEVARDGTVGSFVAAGARLAKARWRDLALAVERSAAFAQAFEAAVETHRSAFTQMLLSSPGLTIALEALGESAVATRIVRAHLASGAVRDDLVAAALDGGPRRAIAVLSYAVADDSELLLRLDARPALSEEERARIGTWPARAPRRAPQLLQLTARVAPTLHASLVHAFDGEEDVAMPEEGLEPPTRGL